jgi:quinol monooxygenase YgiN
MYIRVARGRFDPARYDEMMAVADDLIAALRRLPGFRGYQGGVDRAAGTVVAVSHWDTREHAQFDRAALGDVIPRMQVGGLQQEPAEVYEVVVQTLT